MNPDVCFKCSMNDKAFLEFSTARRCFLENEFRFRKFFEDALMKESEKKSIGFFSDQKIVEMPCCVSVGQWCQTISIWVVVFTIGSYPFWKVIIILCKSPVQKSSDICELWKTENPCQISKFMQLFGSCTNYVDMRKYVGGTENVKGRRIFSLIQ